MLIKDTLENVPEGFEVRARATVSSMGGLLLDAKFEKVALASKLAALTPVATATLETFDGITTKISQFKFEDAAYMTFEFAHTPSIVVTPPLATKPAEEATIAPSSPAAPPPAPLKSATEVAQEVVTLNARVKGWAYVLPDYKSRLFEKKLADLIKKKGAAEEPAAGAQK